MKKILIVLLVILTTAASLVSCARVEEPTLNPGPAPERPPYVPKPLTVEFFYTNYSNMSPWQKYPVDIEGDETPDTPNTSAPVTNEPVPTTTVPITTGTPPITTAPDTE